jgi:peroxiredoxin
VKRAGLIAVVAAAAALGLWAGHRAHQAQLAGTPLAPAGPYQAAPPGAAMSPEEPGLMLAQPIPEQLPEFSLESSDGRATPISTWRGKSLILNFWATWCAPCRREMPLLRALDQERGSQGFRVIGIAVDRRDSVVAFARSLQIDYPLLVGEQDALDVAARLGVASPGLPFTVFTASGGQIVALYLGELHKPQTDLILSGVSLVNAGRLTVQQARRQIAEDLAKQKARSVS